MKSDDRVRYSILLDIYGKLLTDKQTEIFSSYVNDDFSLVEISEMYHISRQGASDTIKTVVTRLEDLEDKLGIQSRNDKITEALDQMITGGTYDREKLEDIKRIILED